MRYGNIGIILTLEAGLDPPTKPPVNVGGGEVNSLIMDIYLLPSGASSESEEL